MRCGVLFFRVEWACLGAGFRVSAAVTCNVGAWSDVPAVCSETCPDLSQPVNAANCSKQVYWEDFSSSAVFNSMFYVSPSVPALIAESYWNVTTGVLNVSTTGRCGVTATIPSLKIMSSPAWMSKMAAKQWMEVNASVQVTSGVIGLVFRVLDSSNYYYAVLDRTVGSTKAGSVVNGAGFTAAYLAQKWTSASYKSGQYFALSVQTNPTGFSVYVDNEYIGAVIDTTFVLGSIGFVASGVGQIDDVVVTTTCDGGTQCVSAASGVTCSYQCAPGYVYVSGSYSRMCDAGVWSGTDLLCSIAPPIFFNQTVSVYEVRLAFASVTVERSAC
jgi:hypothetical protein